MTKAEYDAIQNALDAHLKRVLYHAPLSRIERNAYENAVMACKSVISKNCLIDEQAEMNGGASDGNQSANRD